MHSVHLTEVDQSESKHHSWVEVNSISVQPMKEMPWAWFVTISEQNGKEQKNIMKLTHPFSWHKQNGVENNIYQQWPYRSLVHVTLSQKNRPWSSAKMPLKFTQNTFLFWQCSWFCMERYMKCFRNNRVCANLISSEIPESRQNIWRVRIIFVKQLQPIVCPRYFLTAICRAYTWSILIYY